VYCRLFFPEVKWLRSLRTHPIPNFKVKNAWSYISTPLTCLHITVVNSATLLLFMGISYVKNCTFRTKFHCFSKSQIVRKKVLNVWWITTDCVVAITVCAQMSVITPNKLYPPVIHISRCTYDTPRLYIKNKDKIHLVLGHASFL